MYLVVGVNSKEPLCCIVRGQGRVLGQLRAYGLAVLAELVDVLGDHTGGGMSPYRSCDTISLVNVRLQSMSNVMQLPFLRCIGRSTWQ